MWWTAEQDALGVTMLVLPSLVIANQSRRPIVSWVFCLILCSLQILGIDSKGISCVKHARLLGLNWKEDRSELQFFKCFPCMRMPRFSRETSPFTRSAILKLRIRTSEYPSRTAAVGQVYRQWVCSVHLAMNHGVCDFTSSAKPPVHTTAVTTY